MNLLERLRNSQQSANTSNLEKIVKIPYNKVRFACKNHLGPNKKTMPIAIVFSNPNDLEFICSCGTIYQRDKNLID